MAVIDAFTLLTSLGMPWRQRCEGLSEQVVPTLPLFSDTQLLVRVEKGICLPRVCYWNHLSNQVVTKISRNMLAPGGFAG